MESVPIYVCAHLIDDNVIDIIFVVDPTRHDSVERAAGQDLVAATNTERRQETDNRDCTARTKFVPLVLETYDALSDRSDRFLVECAMLASRECAGSGPSTSLLRTWFRHIVSITLQWSLANEIHNRTLHLE